MNETRKAPIRDADDLFSRLVAIEEAMWSAILDPEPKKQRSLKKVDRLVASLLASAPEEADSHYIAGYARYMIGFDDATEGSQVEGYFRHALSLDPDNLLARLYLGHYHFDGGRYADALACFEVIDESLVHELDQRWRVLKNHELILCCRLHLNSPTLTEADFGSLIEEYLEADEEDVPVPSELAAALSASETSSVWKRIDRKKMVNRVRTFCEQLGCGLAISNDLLY